MLHLVNKSPFERRALESCLRFAVKGSAILLYEDAVLAAVEGTAFTEVAREMAGKYKVYAVGPDIKARGYDTEKVVPGITVVDYGGFVDVVAENGPVQSWT